MYIERNNGVKVECILGKIEINIKHQYFTICRLLRMWDTGSVYSA